MAGRREIRRRIRTVRNVQQITKALKLVAAARLQRAQTRAAEARLYADEMRTLVASLSASEHISYPLLEVREPANVGLIVITSDRGMAGGYNVNIVRRAEMLIEKHGGGSVKIFAVGKRGQVFFRKKGHEMALSFSMPSSEIDSSLAREISREVITRFESRELDAVKLVYTRFYSAMRQVVSDTQILPIEFPVGDVRDITQYIFEPEPGILLGSLLPRYVTNQIYQALLESLASEHAARMAAMTSATDNAQEMIENLTLEYNRARQAAITKELTEIVSSAEAIS